MREVIKVVTRSETNNRKTKTEHKPIQANHLNYLHLPESCCRPYRLHTHTLDPAQMDTGHTCVALIQVSGASFPRQQNAVCWMQAPWRTGQKHRSAASYKLLANNQLLIKYLTSSVSDPVTLLVSCLVSADLHWGQLFWQGRVYSVYLTAHGQETVICNQDVMTLNAIW